MRGITSVTYVTGLGDTPAATNRHTGAVYLNNDTWDDLSTEHKLFVLLHELGHIEKNTSNEFEADAFAFEKYAALGYPLTESVYALSRVLSLSNDEHFERIEAQLQRALTFDASINKNSKADQILKNTFMRKRKLDGFSLTKKVALPKTAAVTTKKMSPAEFNALVNKNVLASIKASTPAKPVSTAKTAVVSAAVITPAKQTTPLDTTFLNLANAAKTAPVFEAVATKPVVTKSNPVVPASSVGVNPIAVVPVVSNPVVSAPITAANPVAVANPVVSIPAASIPDASLSVQAQTTMPVAPAPVAPFMPSPMPFMPPVYPAYDYGDNDFGDEEGAGDYEEDPDNENGGEYDSEDYTDEGLCNDEECYTGKPVQVTDAFFKKFFQKVGNAIVPIVDTGLRLTLGEKAVEARKGLVADAKKSSSTPPIVAPPKPATSAVDNLVKDIKAGVNMGSFQVVDKATMLKSLKNEEEQKKNKTMYIVIAVVVVVLILLMVVLLNKKK